MKTDRTPFAQVLACLDAVLAAQGFVTEDPGVFPRADDDHPEVWGDASEEVCGWCLDGALDGGVSSDQLYDLRGIMTDELLARAHGIERALDARSATVFILLATMRVVDEFQAIARDMREELDANTIDDLRRSLATNLKEVYGVDLERDARPEDRRIVDEARSFVEMWTRHAAADRAAGPDSHHGA